MRFLTLILLIAAIACKSKTGDKNEAQTKADILLEDDSTGASASPYVFNDTILVSLGAKDFAAVCKSKPNMPILDLRPEAKFKTGHIWRSISMDVKAPDFEKNLAAFSRTQEYAVYCHFGDDSFKVAEDMKKMGFLRIYHLQKGLLNWGDSGQALQLK